MRNDFSLEGDFLLIFIHSKTHGELVVYADKCDMSLLSPHRWYADKTRGIIYIKSSTGGRMSRLIMKAPKDLMVDHRNRNTLDNRRINLRICNNQQNAANRIGLRIGYRGVHVEKRGLTLKYRAQVKHKGRVHFSKVFITEIEAAKAYNEIALELFGEFALINQL